MKLKGVNKIDNIINGYLKPFDATARLGADFSYFVSRSLITYAVVMTEKGTADFINSVERWEPSVNADPFLWSLFHELGHHETFHLLEDWEADLSETIKREINEGKRDELEYYTCPDEEAATRWAVEYVDTHIEEVGKLWEVLSAAIQEFFRKNEIEA